MPFVACKVLHFETIFHTFQFDQLVRVGLRYLWQDIVLHSCGNYLERVNVYLIRSIRVIPGHSRLRFTNFVKDWDSG